MSVIQTSTSGFTNDTFNSLSIRDVQEQLLNPHVEAMPTWRVLLAYKQQKVLSPNEKFEIPIKYKDVSPAIAKKNDVFPMDDIDNITTMEIEPIKMKSGIGTNDVDLSHMSGPLAILNHIDIKVDSMHEGFTKVMNTLPWLNRNQSNANDQIDISAILANQSLPPEELVLKNVQAMTDLPSALPLAARNSDTGHTYQNIAVTDTTNAFWRPVITDAPGATVTRETSGSKENIDAVTAVANPVALSLDDLDEHLGQMQEGRQYQVLCAVGRKIFRQLRNIMMAANIRNIDSPIADLGIHSTITWDEYNTTFYLEPKMNALWAASLFFYDPDTFYLCTDPAFDPTSGTGIYPWERISGTTTWASMIYMNYQFVCEDRRGVSAMHGYTSDS